MDNELPPSAGAVTLGHEAAHLANQQTAGLTVTFGVEPVGGGASPMDAARALVNEPASLEGVLYWRQGKHSSSSTATSLWWKKRYVVFDFSDGSLSCYRFKSGHKNQSKPTPTYIPQQKSTKLHRVLSMRGEMSKVEKNDVLALHISPKIPWFVKDVSNSRSCFVVEIETKEREVAETASTDASEADDDSSGSENSDDNFDLGEKSDRMFADFVDDFEFGLDNEEDKDDNGNHNNGDEGDFDLDSNLQLEMAKAKLRGKPLRFYFKCLKGGNEKVLWLKAFARVNRLSSSFQQRNSLLASLKAPAVRLTHSRIRSASSAAFARESKQLDFTPEEAILSPGASIGLNFSTKTRRATREKEHRVLPEAVYPHVWMTQAELREEMEKPSVVFHDLRQNSCRIDPQYAPNNPSHRPEVGSLQLEILQGLGFPKLDRYSQTDAVVYVVCGPYAFCTDVIKNRASPVWLAKTQRACNIPIHHGYARVYIGVFDDEKSTKDDFNGRIVLDVARLRPDCTYDVTLPLRLSNHVYSRRRRGSVRIRFKLRWSSLRSALLSYLPEKISRPRNFRPNTDTVVACGSSRAFRNVAITSHSAHLPGRFSFQQLRSTLREVNFTRKQVMGIFKSTLKELREWENPLISAFIFCAWMHCVYSNAFSLVPAYVVSYIMLHLIRNYARYGMDGPAQRGFIPPAFEELLMGLLDRPSPIKPLNMGYETDIVDGSPVINYTFKTHEPKGKRFFRAMNFLDDEMGADDGLEEKTDPIDHLEFPFSNGTVYPKFTVTDSLASRKNRITTRSGAVNSKMPRNHNRFLVMPKMIRKDSSGMNDYDYEEQRFGTAKFIRKTGATQLKGAASGLIDVGESLTEVTGLQYVVSPITETLRSGIHRVAPPIKSGLKTGYKSGITGINHVVVSPLQHTVDSIRRGSSDIWHGHADAGDSTTVVSEVRETIEQLVPGEGPIIGSGTLGVGYDNHESMQHTVEAENLPVEIQLELDVLPATVIPDQDIDYASNENKKNRKRITDDLVEVKEKMHELTLHKFNDRAYVVKNKESRYFDHHQKTSKRRKLDISSNLDKLLNVGQYSHTNPVVARVGLYVEPIVGASHSFLCAFRALFNVMTWRDPFLTFWVSLFGFALVIILFIFPWRLFLFCLGLWFIGPQNWVIRILRKKGILPPKKPRRLDPTPEDMEVPSDQVVFRGHISQDEKRKSHKPADSREIQYAAVPYSPLMGGRFYDWPPERDYARVYETSFSPSLSAPSFAVGDVGGRTREGSFDSWAPANAANQSPTPPTSNSLFSSSVAAPSAEKKNQ